MIRRPLSIENQRLHNGSHNIPLHAGEVLQDSVSTNGTGWKREEYIDANGQRRARLTRR